MAVHKAERFVRETLASILAQSFRDFEVLIVADDTVDRTAEIVAGFRDSRIRYLATRRRLRLPEALNIGLAEAAGELIARHDHDDLSHPERLARQVAYLNAHDEVALLGSRARLIDESSQRVGRLDRPVDEVSVRWHHLLDNPFVHSSVMFRRRVVWDELGGYDASLSSSEDYELWSRLLRRYAAVNLPERLLSYRLAAVSKMTADADAWEEGTFPKVLRAIVRQNIVNVCGDIASDEELRVMGGYVLGVPRGDVDRFMRVFWRLAAAFEERVPAARHSAGYRRTVATEVDGVVAKMHPFCRRAAVRLYRRALAARPSLAWSLPWGRALARFTLGASGRAQLARLQRQGRLFSLAV